MTYLNSLVRSPLRSGLGRVLGVLFIHLLDKVVALNVYFIQNCDRALKFDLAVIITFYCLEKT